MLYVKNHNNKQKIKQLIEFCALTLHCDDDLDPARTPKIPAIKGYKKGYYKRTKPYSPVRNKAFN